MIPLPEKRLFTVQDAASYLVSIGAVGVTVVTVRAMIASGQLPYIRMGKRFYVTRTALDAWIERHERRNR